MNKGLEGLDSSAARKNVSPLQNDNNNPGRHPERTKFLKDPDQ